MSGDEKGTNPPSNRQMNVIISRKPKIDEEKNTFSDHVVLECEDSTANSCQANK